MTTERHNDPDILESAVSEFRQIGDSRGPSPEALERTREAMRAVAQERPGIRLAERIRHMSRLRKPLLVAAVAAVFIIGFAVWMLLPSDGKTGVVFADVQRQIERTQTMTLTAVAETMGMKKPMTMKMFFKSPGLMRQETTVEPDAFLAPGATRPATGPAAEKVISIFDMPNQKGLSLVPSQKKAMVIEFKNMPAEQVAKAKEQNILEELKKAVAGKHQELGEKKINGVQAKGYRCKPAGMQLMTMDIWVDASTALPLVVEEAMSEPFVVKVTMTNFVVDGKLDDSLFDMKVPDGYSTETEVVDFNISEDELVKYLRLFAERLGGVFPRSIMPTPDLIKQLEKVSKTKEASAAEKKEVGRLLQRAMLFQMKTTMQGGEFVYAGEGVKLGDEAAAILWYKAKDAKTYRVIYGDLHVEDADTAPKRPATQPAERDAAAKETGSMPANKQSH